LLTAPVKWGQHSPEISYLLTENAVFDARMIMISGGSKIIENFAFNTVILLNHANFCPHFTGAVSSE